MGQLKITPQASIEDSQLKTPQHDKMCLALLNKETLLAYIKYDKIIQEKIHYLNFREKEEVINDEIIFEEPILEITNPEMEKVLKASNGFILGYIDIFFFIKAKIKWVGKTKKGELQREIPVAIEVKPKITSIGEVMRQLKTYSSQKIMSEGDWKNYHVVLFSPTKQYKEIFEGQGLSFWGLEVVE